jgi:cell division protein ZapA
MAIVNLTIHNNTYQIACDDGEEEHLKRLGANLNDRVSQVALSLPKASESLLLIITALMMEDELQDVSKNNTPKSVQEEIDLAVADAIDSIAECMENIAKKVKIV